MEDIITPRATTPSASAGLSYKFQRLREKLRQAIAIGELSGKLPGERSLAKRFHVNAKTLSKALTDLAAEGVLDRSIGRGTYVKGHAPVTGTVKRWLVVCDVDQTGWDLIQMLRASHPDLDLVTDVSSVRPSFLNQFSAVIDLAAATSDSFLRDLVVRNIPVVVVGREPRTYSTHAVLFDAPQAVVRLARDLVLAGHRRLASVEPVRENVITPALRAASARYASDTTVDSCSPSDVSAMIESGVTAFVCPDVDSAHQVKGLLASRGISVPGPVTVTAIGTVAGEPPFSGYFASRADEVAAINQLLADSQSNRPTTLWLAGQAVDRGTISPIVAQLSEHPTLRYNAATA